MRREKARKLIAISTIAVLGLATSGVYARNDVLFQTGDAAATGYTFQNYFVPVISDNGQVAFIAQLKNATDPNAAREGVFLLNTETSGLTTIALAGTSADGTGLPNTTVSEFTQVLLNNAGDLAFSGYVNSYFQQGNFAWVPGSQTWNGHPVVTEVAVPGQQFWLSDPTTYTFGGAVHSITSPSAMLLNDRGYIAFSSYFTPSYDQSTSGVFMNVPLNAFGTVALGFAGEWYPDPTTQMFSSVGPVYGYASGIYDLYNGTALFAATFNGANGTTGDGLFLGSTQDGAGADRGKYFPVNSTVVLDGQMMASGAQVQWLSGFPSINNSKQVAFWAALSGSGTINASNNGLFVESRSAYTQVAVLGDGFTGGSQHFAQLGNNPAINQIGQVAFSATLDGNGTTTPASGVFLWTAGGAPAAVALQGEQTRFGPIGNVAGPTGIAGTFELNNAGDVAFTDGRGIFLGDTVDLIPVTAIGQPLDGSTISSLRLSPGQVNSGANVLNDYGQVVYSATLANGKQVLGLFTPELHFRSTTSGSWDTPGNWTLGIAPAQVHDVFIDPADGLTVTGPAGSATVRSLTIGATANGTAVLQMNGAGSLSTVADLTVLPTGELDQLGSSSTNVGGTLSNQGRVAIASGATLTTGSGFTNSGTLALTGGTLSGATVTNTYTGVVTGSGTVNAPLVNDGTIQLSAGDTLGGSGTITNDVSGYIAGNGTISAPLSNAGLIQVPSGSTLALSNLLANAGGGQMLVADQGRLSVSNSFANSGAITLGGPAAMLAGGGALTNAAGGVISGAGRIVNPILNGNDGTVRVSSGGTLTLLAAGNINDAGGQIQIGPGGSLVYAQGLGINAGAVTLDAGGTFDNNAQPITNTGSISGVGATIRTGGFTNAAGGSLVLADAASAVYGSVDNHGLIRLMNNTTTFFGPVTNDTGGTLQTINATAQFLAGFTNVGTIEDGPAVDQFRTLAVGPGGFLSAGAGQRFTLLADFVNDSTQPKSWNTSGAEFDLAGSPVHHFDVTGLDLGPTRDGYVDNFAIGVLSLASGESLVLQGDNGGGGLYLGALELGGGVNQIGSITGNGVDVYYDPNNAANGYLGDQSYALARGGMLEPVAAPEPGMGVVLGVVGCGMLMRRRGGLRGDGARGIGRSHLGELR